MVTESELRLVKDDLVRWHLGGSDAAILTGSRAEGFGNKHSDFDIYMLVADPQKSFTAKRTSLIEGYLYIQYECFSVAQASVLAYRINELYDSSDDNAFSKVTLDEIDRYYRTSIGVPLVDEQPQDNLLSLYKRDVASHVFASWTLRQAMRQMALSHQMRLSGRVEQASFAARNCLEWAIDSWLAHHGEGFPSRKWRFEKFSRAFGRDSEMYVRAWELKNIGTRSFPSYTEAALSLATEMGVPSEGLPNLLDIAPRPRSDVATFTIRSQPYILKNRMRLYALGPTSSRVWHSINSGQWDGSAAIDLIAKAESLCWDEAEDRLVELLNQLALMEVINWID